MTPWPFHGGRRMVPAPLTALIALASTVGLLVMLGAQITGPSRAPAAHAADPTPTPACPGGGTDGAPLDRCTHLTISGNTYTDANGNGRYDPNAGTDSRLSGVEVVLTDVGGAVLARTVTNKDGYYRFPLLPVGPTYRVVVTVPPDRQPTTPVYRELELSDFSTYWCCSARADFGFKPGPRQPTAPPPPPLVPPQGTPVPPPCCEAPAGQQVHLPILSYEANENVCQALVEVQNIGAWPSKALLVVWGAPGACPPQCAGPLKVECSGLLAPGSSWNFLGGQLPDRAKSGMVFSAPAVSAPGAAAGNDDVFADLLCEALFHDVVGNCNAFRRFKTAFNEDGRWQAGGYQFDFGAYPGAALAVEVVRKCPGDLNPMVTVSAGYSGLADGMLGAYDPVYGGHAYFAPLLYADRDGLDSWLYVQNGGVECTSVEVWFKAQDDCLRPQVCDVLTLAPGETHQLAASSCVGPGWIGSAYVRGSEPLGLVVDTIGWDVLTSYRAHPSELKYAIDGPPAFSAASHVLYGPLLYSEYQGWDTLVQVQNLSSVTNAKVKVYFLDRSGSVITALTDWICPAGSQGFYLPVVAELPGNWVGSVRVESQDWFAAGQPQVDAPSVTAAAQMVKYADVARSQTLEAMAYDLLPEGQAFDWQIGSGWGGLYSGVGRIGVPSLLKDQRGVGLTTELAIANVVPKPGFTDFAIYIYDQNGLVSHLCQKLAERQVEYIDVERGMAFLPGGFKGSAVISAVYWEHPVFDGAGRFQRNLVGLAAVKVERAGTTLGIDVPGDESAASPAFPMVGPFRFAGPPISCPGVPGGMPGRPPGQPTPPPGPGVATATPPPTSLPPPGATPTGGVPTPPGPPGPP